MTISVVGTYSNSAINGDVDAYDVFFPATSAGDLIIVWVTTIGNGAYPTVNPSFNNLGVGNFDPSPSIAKYKVSSGGETTVSIINSSALDSHTDVLILRGVDISGAIFAGITTNTTSGAVVVFPNITVDTAGSFGIHLFVSYRQSINPNIEYSAPTDGWSLLGGEGIGGYAPAFQTVEGKASLSIGLDTGISRGLSRSAGTIFTASMYVRPIPETIKTNPLFFGVNI